MVVWLHKQVEETQAAADLVLVILYNNGSKSQRNSICSLKIKRDQSTTSLKGSLSLTKIM